MDEKIVNLGAFRARLQRAAGGNSSVCRHKHVIIDPDAGTIFCDDCKAYVSAFHTVVSWVGQWEEVVEAVNIQKRRLAAIWRTARNYRPRMRAIQALERAWWRSGMLPCCPHCRRGLLPEDFVDGAELTVSRDLEVKRRERDAAAQAGGGR